MMQEGAISYGVVEGAAKQSRMIDSLSGANLAKAQSLASELSALAIEMRKRGATDEEVHTQLAAIVQRRVNSGEFIHQIGRAAIEIYREIATDDANQANNEKQQRNGIVRRFKQRLEKAVQSLTSRETRTLAESFIQHILAAAAVNRNDTVAATAAVKKIFDTLMNGQVPTPDEELMRSIRLIVRERQFIYQDREVARRLAVSAYRWIQHLHATQERQSK